MVSIDAKGKACPTPVILAKKQLDLGVARLNVEVDNPSAVQNLLRLGESLRYTTATREIAGGFCVEFTATDASSAAVEVAPAPTPKTGDWALFIGNPTIGQGSEELGGNLMTMFFYTLSQGDDLPKSILFMNSGVTLPTQNAQIVEHLRTLAARGCEILVCGTCLNFYGLAEELKIGTVSNMYDITLRMQAASKVISF